MTDLRTIGFHCFLWWCQGSWDNRISSVETGPGAQAALYDYPWVDPNAGLLIIQPNTFCNLTDLGWNDRPSAIAVGRI